MPRRSTMFVGDIIMTFWFLYHQYHHKWLCDSFGPTISEIT
jgi:hypothetical protein